MPDLPTFKNLTDEEFSVLIETFVPFEGATLAQTREAFLADLRDWLMARAKAKRREVRQAAQAFEIAAENSECEAALPQVARPEPEPDPEPEPSP